MERRSSYEPRSNCARWFDARLPIVRFLYDTFIGFAVPANLNFWWVFGAILLFCLFEQIVTGIALAMHYTPRAGLAFASVASIMRDVNYGWLLRYAHANGASMFFIAVYAHMFRGLYYGSYKTPREVTWIVGVFIYLLMMATAFFGYVLPWGQMSFWSATVVANLIGSVPFFGSSLKQWVCGDFTVGDPTLNRFFVLHFLLPFVVLLAVTVHVWALHVSGSNNPVGVEAKPSEKVPFYPCHALRDAFGLVLFLLLFAYFTFYDPLGLSDVNNAIPADPMQTPEEIVPEWYFLPFYAILRSIPGKLEGILVLLLSIGLLFALPWLDTSKVLSARYRPMFRRLFWIFVVDCLVLGWCGGRRPDVVLFRSGLFELTVTGLARVCVAYYFAYFLVLMPVLGRIENTLPVPKDISSQIRVRRVRSSE